MEQATAQTNGRRVLQVVRGRPTSDGAGVRPSRLMGAP